MGLDITAYSRLRHVVVGEGHVHIHAGEFDRLDGLPPGNYVRTTDADVWWRAEHGAELPESERARTDERVAAIQAGMKPECPGDLAVLADARPLSEEHAFRAGSYSGYNWWRATLSNLAHDVEPQEIWDDYYLWMDQAFVELINFSDAEGTIGPKTAAKLAKDFAFYELQILSRAQQVLADEGEREYFIDAYEEWKRAFELAAQDGFVIFH